MGMTMVARSVVCSVLWWVALMVVKTVVVRVVSTVVLRVPQTVEHLVESKDVD